MAVKRRGFLKGLIAIVAMPAALAKVVSTPKPEPAKIDFTKALSEHLGKAKQHALSNGIRWDSAKLKSDRCFITIMSPEGKALHFKYNPDSTPPVVKI